MSRPTCETCPYWDRAGLVCRRKPASRFSDKSGCAWPCAEDRDWCGQHPDFPAWLEATREPGCEHARHLPVMAAGGGSRGYCQDCREIVDLPVPEEPDPSPAAGPDVAPVKASPGLHDLICLTCGHGTFARVQGDSQLCYVCGIGQFAPLPAPEEPTPEQKLEAMRSVGKTASAAAVHLGIDITEEPTLTVGKGEWWRSELGGRLVFVDAVRGDEIHYHYECGDGQGTKSARDTFLKVFRRVVPDPEPEAPEPTTLDKLSACMEAYHGYTPAQVAALVEGCESFDPGLNACYGSDGDWCTGTAPRACPACTLRPLLAPFRSEEVR